MSQQNKHLVRRVFEEGFNQGRLAIADELIATDFVDHGAAPGVPATGPESLRQTMTIFRAAFPDVQATIDDLIAEGDMVVVRSMWRGSHQGEFFGIPPTGRQFAMTAIDILRIANGKVAEHWGNEDDLGMLSQLGVIASPGSEAQAGK